MLTDWYQAILDLNAKPEDTKKLAIAVTSRLASEGIITIYRSDSPVTHITGKFAPGPNFAQASGEEPGYSALNTGGMDICLETWINEYGIAGMDSANCPSCNFVFNTDTFEATAKLKESFVVAGDKFVKERCSPFIFSVLLVAYQRRLMGGELSLIWVSAT